MQTTASSDPKAGKGRSAAALPAGTGALRRESGAGGLSFEMQRFSDGIRVVIALLCTVLLLGAERAPQPAALLLLMVYDLWAGVLLWARARRLRVGPTLLHFWLDAAWSCAMLQATDGASQMLILTLVHPTVLVSVGWGSRQAVLLAVAAASAVLWCNCADEHGARHLQNVHLLPALAVLALVPAAALLARSMGVLHQRRQMMERLHAEIDPRRGLGATAATLLQAILRESPVRVAAVVLTSPVDHASGWIADGHGDAGRPGAAVRALDEDRVQAIEAALQAWPDEPVTCRRHRMGSLLLRSAAENLPPLTDDVVRLHASFEEDALVVVPFSRQGRRIGYLLMAADPDAASDKSVDALGHGAAEMGGLLESAALVDRLQDETAAHERARIGRDLHDSAIQPYLGLKFVVESVAMKARADNPLRDDLVQLGQLVQAEVEQLRELIGGMRDGRPHGDNALLPAVRRQSRRYAQMFGIDVQLDLPPTLSIRRELAGALFHMINEALSNVRRHTPARSVRLSLQTDVQGAIQLRIRDDAGSVCGRPAAEFRPRSLSERAADLGGSLVVSRPDGLNTEVLIHIPFQTPASA
ncbi:sensor histidine kinase [Leptothrix sp. BB-4]